MLRKVCFLVAFAAVANAAPQLLLDTSSSLGLDEDAPFNDNPQYTYSYQVAADDEQTYIAHTESRDGADVTGEYSYVDPLGNLIKVTYTAGAMGYTETREVVPNFVQIRSRPVTPEPVPAPAPVRPVVQQVRPAVQQVQQVTTSSSSNDGDLVANIIAQLTPFIRTTVSNSLGGSSGSSSSSSSGASQTTTTTTSQRQPVNVGTTRRVVSRQPVPTVRRIVETAPVVTETSSSSSAVSNIFGTGGPNNVRFESPDSSFAFDLN